jgi:hypothetical protein
MVVGLISAHLSAEHKRFIGMSTEGKIGIRENFLYLHFLMHWETLRGTIY